MQAQAVWVREVTFDSATEWLDRHAASTEAGFDWDRVGADIDRLAGLITNVEPAVGKAYLSLKRLLRAQKQGASSREPKRPSEGGSEDEQTESKRRRPNRDLEGEELSARPVRAGAWEVPEGAARGSRICLETGRLWSEGG